MGVVMKLQVPQYVGNVVCFLPGRAKDLSAPLHCSPTCKPQQIYKSHLKIAVFTVVIQYSHERTYWENISPSNSLKISAG